VTGSYMDYAMPRADDVPFYTIEHNTTVCPNNPLGIKGCGRRAPSARRPP
jgi:aerobic carbon-monoxide dehydrogenase large subunit